MGYATPIEKTGHKAIAVQQLIGAGRERIVKSLENSVESQFESFGNAASICRRKNEVAVPEH
jgi:hypothetical protein